MYKLCFYVPDSHLEHVKNALFAKGAGQIGPYDHCAWQTKGIGQYRPLADSHPYAGEKNKVCTEEEYLVELVCSDDKIRAAVSALLKVHPYETPAYNIVKLVDLNELY